MPLLDELQPQTLNNVAIESAAMPVAVVISLLRLSNAEGKALGAADTFPGDGMLDEVVVLG